MTLGMTITEFLEARIAEDETVARSATRMDKRDDGIWTADPHDAEVEGLGIKIYDEGGHDEDQAAHIARHDPARVLAECAAKRAIIAEWEDPATFQTWGSDVDAGYTIATDKAVRAIAAVYADHPDYLQEWAL